MWNVKHKHVILILAIIRFQNIASQFTFTKVTLRMVCHVRKHVTEDLFITVLVGQYNWIYDSEAKCCSSSNIFWSCGD